MELTVAITGASGTIYAHRTLQLMAQSGSVDTINLIMSETAATVAKVETGANLDVPTVEIINEWLGLPFASNVSTATADGFIRRTSSGRKSCV